MHFQRSEGWHKIGFYSGLLISFCIFTVVLFAILRYFNKLPREWTVVNFAGITVAVLLIGYVVERWLR